MLTEFTITIERSVCKHESFIGRCRSFTVHWGIRRDGPGGLSVVCCCGRAFVRSLLRPGGGSGNSLGKGDLRWPTLVSKWGVQLGEVPSNRQPVCVR